MKAIFLTQSGTLDFFRGLQQTMARSHGLDRVGYLVTDSRYFGRFAAENPDFPGPDASLVKEWEVFVRAKERRPDAARLADLENRLGHPTLWNALVADRRIYLGKRATYSQDYAPRFSHRQMLGLADAMAGALERLFDEIQPDFVAGFICVTLGDYLGWRIAEARGIPFLNLRPTRVDNYIFAGEDVLEPSPYLQKAYEKALAEDGTGPEFDNAAEILDKARREHALYEGVYKPSAKTPEENLKKLEAKRSRSQVWADRLDNVKKYYAHYRHDNHVPGYVDHFLHRRVVKPFRARMLDRVFRPRYAPAKDLAQGSFAFFPLHTEPEVTLLLYSKPWLNQIEAARLIASSLPLGMKLVVKEHPWSVGKRPLSYYRKLLQIPNLVLAPPETPARDFVQKAALTVVISGSVGLEALMLEKPVITLGRAPFNFLPDTMLRYVDRPDGLGFAVRELLSGHIHDEKALTAYMAAVMRSSCPVDFYTRLLKRQGAFSAHQGGDPEEERRRQLQLMADYMAQQAGIYASDKPGRD